MNQINKVELAGFVGNVNFIQLENTSIARLSVLTEYVSRSRDGQVIIESTWHNVTIWENKMKGNLKDIQKRSKIHVIGRIRNTKYIASSGEERQITEILASEAELIPDEEK